MRRAWIELSLNGQNAKRSPNAWSERSFVAAIQNKSACDIQQELKLNIVVRRFQHILAKTPYMRYLKQTPTGKMTEQHERDWAYDGCAIISARKRTHGKMKFSPTRRSLICTVRVRSSITGMTFGPNQRFFRRVGGGGLLMISEVIFYKDDIRLEPIVGPMNSDKELQYLTTLIFHGAHNTLSDKWISKQDNSSVHSSK